MAPNLWPCDHCSKSEKQVPGWVSNREDAQLEQLAGRGLRYLITQINRKASALSWSISRHGAEPRFPPGLNTLLGLGSRAWFQFFVAPTNPSVGGVSTFSSALPACWNRHILSFHYILLENISSLPLLCLKKFSPPRYCLAVKVFGIYII